MGANLTISRGGERGGPAPRFHRCAICDKREPWGPKWMHYSSYAMEEICPDAVPKLCSDKCRKEFERRVEDGRIRLPVLSKHYPQRVLREHSGYYDQ